MIARALIVTCAMVLTWSAGGFLAAARGYRIDGYRELASKTVFISWLLLAAAAACGVISVGLP